MTPQTFAAILIALIGVCLLRAWESTGWAPFRWAAVALALIALGVLFRNSQAAALLAWLESYR